MTEMKSPDPECPVLVTGATGYIAGWLVARLLDEGFTVHAAVRNPENKAKIQHLVEMGEGTAGSIRFFDADLLKPGSYKEAMTGCEVVFHTASPFTLDESNPMESLVEPALEGTRNVLNEAVNCESVRRVVVTSSCAAVYGDNADIEKTQAGKFTEEDWNTTSSLEHKPYSFSKVLAEKEAWKIYESQDQWDLVTINPSLVMGPGKRAESTSGSSELVQQLAGGRLRMGVPDYAFGLVDVRDVAEAHFKAGTDYNVPVGRYIINGRDSSLPEIAKVLKSRFDGDYPFPLCTIPKWMAWLFGPLVDKSLSRELIRRNVGIRASWDNSKSRELLGIQYADPHEAVVRMFEQMVESGKIRT